MFLQSNLSGNSPVQDKPQAFWCTLSKISLGLLILTGKGIGLRVPNNSKTVVVVPIVRIVPIAVSNAAIVIIVVPRAATKNVHFLPDLPLNYKYLE